MASSTKPKWVCYHLLPGAYEIAREGDYATGTICCVHSQADADLVVTALNFYEESLGVSPYIKAGGTKWARVT